MIHNLLSVAAAAAETAQTHSNAAAACAGRRDVDGAIPSTGSAATAHALCENSNCVLSFGVHKAGASIHCVVHFASVTAAAAKAAHTKCDCSTSSASGRDTSREIHAANSTRATERLCRDAESTIVKSVDCSCETAGDVRSGSAVASTAADTDSDCASARPCERESSGDIESARSSTTSNALCEKSTRRSFIINWFVSIGCACR